MFWSPVITLNIFHAFKKWCLAQMTLSKGMVRLVSLSLWFLSVAQGALAAPTVVFESPNPAEYFYDTVKIEGHVSGVDNLFVAGLNVPVGKDGAFKVVRPCIPGRTLIPVQAVSLDDRALHSYEVPVTCLSHFPDADKHWAREEINVLSTVYGLPGSFGTSQFQPDRLLTRAEFAWLLCKFLRLKEKVPEKPTFADVLPEHWAYAFVSVAAKLPQFPFAVGPMFSPDGYVSRADFVAVLIAEDGHLPLQKVAVTLQDVSPEFPKAGVIKSAIAEGLLPKAWEANHFFPYRPVTRAEAFALFARHPKVISFASKALDRDLQFVSWQPVAQQHLVQKPLPKGPEIGSPLGRLHLDSAKNRDTAHLEFHLDQNVKADEVRIVFGGAMMGRTLFLRDDGNWGDRRARDNTFSGEIPSFVSAATSRVNVVVSKGGKVISESDAQLEKDAVIRVGGVKHKRQKWMGKATEFFVWTYDGVRDGVVKLFRRKTDHSNPKTLADISQPVSRTTVAFWKAGESVNSKQSEVQMPRQSPVEKPKVVASAIATESRNNIVSAERRTTTKSSTAAKVLPTLGAVKASVKVSSHKGPELVLANTTAPIRPSQNVTTPIPQAPAPVIQPRPPVALQAKAPTPTAASVPVAKPVAVTLPETSIRYTVVDGDTLPKISRRLTGNIDNWPVIASYNGLLVTEAKDVSGNITKQCTIVAGMVLLIPRPLVAVKDLNYNAAKSETPSKNAKEGPRP